MERFCKDLASNRNNQLWKKKEMTPLTNEENKSY